MSIARPIRAGRNAPTRAGNPRKDSLTSPRNLPSQNPVSAARTRPKISNEVTGPGNKVTNGQAATTRLGSVVVAAVAVVGAVVGVASGLSDVIIQAANVVSHKYIKKEVLDILGETR